MQHEKFVAASAIAVAVTLASIFWLRPLARRIGLVDEPNNRKRHRGRVPLIGGLCFFLGTISGLVYLGNLDHFIVSLLASGSLIVLSGLVDDLYDLKPRTRLFIQAGVVAMVIASTGVHIDSAGALFGGEPVRLYWLGIPLTVVAVVGLVNAFNMLDGIDGLAGSLALVSIASIFAFSGASWPVPSALLVLQILAIALVPYLLVNLGWPDGRRIFMGDAGSMVIGFVLAWSVIHLSQRDAVLAPVDALWCVALPVLDTLAVMYQRMRRGESPFRADRSHLHHLLLDAGLSPRKALGLVVLAGGTLAALGYALRDAPEGVSLLVLLGVLAVYVLQLPRAISWLRLAVLGQLPEPLPGWVSGMIAAGLGKSWLHLLLGKQGDAWSARQPRPQAASDGEAVRQAASTLAPEQARRSAPADARDERLNALCVLDGTPEGVALMTIVQQLSADTRFNARICVAGLGADDVQVHDDAAGSTGQDGATARGHQDPAEVVSRVLGETRRMFSTFRPDVVLLHGASPTVLATALTAYYKEIPVACVEVGSSARADTQERGQADGRLPRATASLHFTSTQRAGDDLIAAGIPQERITVTGSPHVGDRQEHAHRRSIDACMRIADVLAGLPGVARSNGNASVQRARDDRREMRIATTGHASHDGSTSAAAGDRT